MMKGRGRALGAGLLVACVLSAGGCGGDDAKNDASGGAASTGGTAGAAGQGGAAGAPSCDVAPAPTGDATFDEVAKWFHDTSTKWNVPGGALVVYHQGKLHTMVYGSKKADACDPVTAQTRFNGARLASIALAAIAARASQGPNPIVDLDQPITKYIPYFQVHFGTDAEKQRAAKVTLRQLLSYTAGYWPTGWSAGACADIAPPEAQGTRPRGSAGAPKTSASPRGRGAQPFAYALRTIFAIVASCMLLVPS